MDGLERYDPETGEVNPARSMPAVPAQESRPQNLIFASGECGQVFGALCAMQGTMDAPKRTKTAKVKGRTKGGAEYDYSYAYAPLEEIISTAKTPMASAGLAYRQFLASREGQWVMRTIIAHQSGEWFGCDYPIFWDESRGMQGFASGVTYSRRYGLMLALGIAAEDDDDANLADGQPAQINSGGRGGRRNAPAATGVAGNSTKAPPEPPQPAEASEPGEATKQFRLVADQISASHSLADLDMLMNPDTCPMYAKLLQMANSAGEAGKGVIARMERLANQRAKQLEADDIEPPRHVGEMA